MDQAASVHLLHRNAETRLWEDKHDKSYLRISQSLYFFKIQNSGVSRLGGLDTCNIWRSVNAKASRLKNS
jgi:hypothetical protein